MNTGVNVAYFSNNCQSQELLLYQKALKHLRKLVKDLGWVPSSAQPEERKLQHPELDLENGAVWALEIHWHNEG